MKIGIDCRLFSSKFTGIGRYTHELVENFIELNAALKTPHELVLFFNDPEYKDFTCPAYTKKVLVNAKHYSIDEQFVFLNKLNKENLDLVHFPHFNIPVLYSKPYIVTIHDLTLSMFPGQKMTKWYHRVGYNLTIKNAVKKAKRVIAISENTKKDLMRLLGVPEKKITVIYNGITPEFKVIPEYKNEPHPPFLLYAGVWRSHKNLPGLIAAFHVLKNKNPEFKDVKLIITGKPDPHYPEVQRSVHFLGLEKDVKFPGLVSEQELIKLYNQAKIFVFPSFYEGFGFPPLEAMRCGTPVAAANSSSIPEVCGAENAVYFDPHDINSIAESILSLYKNTALREKLIKNGLAHAAKFSWKKSAKETWEMILDCLDKRG